MSKNFIFSSESVGEGHPDKVARHHFRRRAGRLPRAGQVQPRRLRNLREVQPRRRRRRNHHQGASSIINADRPRRHPRHRLRATTTTCFTPTRFSSSTPSRRSRPTSRRAWTRAKAEGQEDRRAGRRRPGLDVRLRLQRDAGADARADHVRAPARRANSRASARPARSRWLRPDAKSQVSVAYETTSRWPSPTSSSPRSTRADVKHKDDRGILHRARHQESSARSICSRRRRSFSSTRPAVSSSADRRATPA